jgi:D-beta-D-heptose 7-phosphate kinase/D-beta-D-heptose 1-phosphate adenosyltransferase
VVVVGDLILDEYFWGEIERISPEAPVPVLRLRRAEHMLGGAANVARNLASMGALVSAVGVAGTDTAATALIDSLDEAGIDRESVLLEEGRPTTRKCRLMSIEHSQQVFRFDVEVTEEIPAAVEVRLLAALQEQIGSADAVVCSDYRKGVLTPRVLREITAMVRKRGIALVTAPKDTKAEKYAGATVLMPNLREFAGLAGERVGLDVAMWLDQAAERLLGEQDFAALLVTRGREGMTLFEQTAEGVRREDIASGARSVYDVTGAGDTALAVFALGLAAGATRSQAAQLANITAGIVVGKRGTACVTVQEILERIIDAGKDLPAPAHAGTA